MTFAAQNVLKKVRKVRRTLTLNFEHFKLCFSAQPLLELNELEHQKRSNFEFKFKFIPTLILDAGEVFSDETLVYRTDPDS